MHKSLKLLFIFLIGIMGCTGEVGHIREPSNLVHKIGDNTVALVFNDSDGVRVFCTGVWLEGNKIATAHHCVRAVANKIAKSGIPAEIADELDIDVDVMGVKIHYIVQGEVKGVGEEPSGIHLGKVVMDDSEHDVAIVRAMSGGIPAHSYAVMANEVPGVGEKVEVIGHVKGLYWSYVEGVVSAWREDLPMAKEVKISGPFLQLSAPVYYGNSGGGVFNMDGELVGIVSFLAVGVPMTNFVIPVSRVRAMLKDK